MMDRPQQLWRYEENHEEISSWLDGWLNHQASPIKILAWAWFYGEAEGDSGWTRDRELSQWIEASKTYWHAWEGIKYLLTTLRKCNQPLPVALVQWALDVADGTRRAPKRSRGRDGTQYGIRNKSMVTAIWMLQSGGLPATSNTGISACHVVAEILNLSYEAVRTVWQKNKEMTLEDYLRVDRGF